MTEPRKATHIDVAIGRHIRARRAELGITQVELAKLLGITFQQLQKHETGVNRVSAARLFEVARILKVPFEYFFQESKRQPMKPALLRRPPEPEKIRDRRPSNKG